MNIRRGDEPEQPPADIIARGQNPAFREVTIEDPLERDRLCRAAGVDANDKWNAHRIVACVDLKGQTAYLPPNPNVSLLRHERGHEWYLVHDQNGQGFHSISPTAPTFDWAQAFHPTETATTKPRGLFGGTMNAGK